LTLNSQKGGRGKEGKKEINIIFLFDIKIQEKKKGGGGEKKMDEGGDEGGAGDGWTTDQCTIDHLFRNSSRVKRNDPTVVPRAHRCLRKVWKHLNDPNGDGMVGYLQECCDTFNDEIFPDSKIDCGNNLTRHTLWLHLERCPKNIAANNTMNRYRASIQMGQGLVNGTSTPVQVFRATPARNQSSSQ